MKTKKLLSFILAICIFVSVFVCVDMTAYATDISNTTNEEQADVTQQASEPEGTEAPTVEPTGEETEAPTTSTDSVICDESKVGYVGKLHKESKASDHIVIYWEGVENVEGYRVYYKNNDTDSDFRFLVATTATKIKLANLTQCTPYEFKVAAYITEGDTIIEGKPRIGKTGTQPAKMGKPSLKKSSTTIKISWKKNSKADGYRIYRQHAKTKGKLVLYKTIKKNSTTSFEDKKVTTGRYYNYQVRAYREMYTDKVYVGTGSTVKTVAGLNKPTLISCTSQLRRVSIDWKKSYSADGYDIYYKADDRTSYKFLANTKNTHYTTKRLRVGREYNFRIKPYKLVGSKKIKVYGTYRSVTKKTTTKAYGKNIGDTYIEISLKDQRMWFYIDGKLYVETPVVTGNYYSSPTPTGAYKIWQRIRGTNLTGPTWSSYVDYWLAFTYSGCGIHDASWRSSSEFGGTTYMGNGSHGCVNTPTSAVSKIFSKAKIGTYVVLY